MNKIWEDPATVAASLAHQMRPRDPMDEMETAEGICALPIQHLNTDIDRSVSALYPLTDAQLSEAQQAGERG